MAFRDFTFPDVKESLGLTLAEADLFGTVPPLPLAPDFVARMRTNIDLALAVSTEKARSEFIIAPILLELRQLLGGSFGLFSGVELNVDSSRGLNGFCDFLLTRSPMQSVLTAPVVTIVEAKNDNLKLGLGQCIAEMVAAQELNAKAKSSVDSIHGVVTTGASWKFLQLSQTRVTLDPHEYFIAELGRIMGILNEIVKAK